MTKYLVTGSTGFVGSRLLGLLKTRQCDVRLLAKYEVEGFETVVCDLAENRLPPSTLESIDTVFHLVGFTHDMQITDKVNNLYRTLNVESTNELANLAVKSGVKRFVFVSSVKAGGLPLTEQCASESDQTLPDGIYGKTKREAELELLKIGKESGMHVAIIRPSLVYGPNVKGNLQLMMSSIKKGWFPPLPETGNKRSMIHVDDLVKAIVLVAEDGRANGEIFIATDGISYSAREIYVALCNALNKVIPKWSIPKFFLDLASALSPRIKYSLNKLMGNERYSSDKLKGLGFKAQKTLKDINETSF